jgi:hypothetical protein
VNATPTIDEPLQSDFQGRGTDPTRLRESTVRRATKGRKPTAHSLPIPPKSGALPPAAARQLCQLPDFAPLLEEIELAGWSSHRRRLSGNFHDWMLLADGRVLAVVGQAIGADTPDEMEAALVSQAAWATIRAHALHARNAGTLLSLAARSLWPMPAATLFAAVAVALVDPIGGRASVAIAGDCLVWRVRAATIESLSDRQPAIGASSDFVYRSHDLELSPRERLILVADQPAHRDRKCLPSIESAFTCLDAQSHRRMTAADAVALVREKFNDEISGESDHNSQMSASIVAVRRR